LSLKSKVAGEMLSAAKHDTSPRLHQEDGVAFYATR
jgi:hypothetical protein